MAFCLGFRLLKVVPILCSVDHLSRSVNSCYTRMASAIFLLFSAPREFGLSNVGLLLRSAARMNYVNDNISKFNPDCEVLRNCN